MANNHRARLDKLEPRVWINHPPRPVFDWALLQEAEGEIIEQASDILDRAEAEYVRNGGEVPTVWTRAYRRELFRSMSDEDLEMLERAVEILDRIQVGDGFEPLSPIPRTSS